MENLVQDELNRINASSSVLSEFEMQVMGDIAKWSVDNSIIVDDLVTASRQYWDQLLG